jgi:putative transposase
LPWGLYRFHQSRLPHFITFTCYRRQSLLSTPDTRDALLRILERTRLRYDFMIYGSVVMPNHVHLLISEPKQGTIATVIQSLKVASARYQKTHICQQKADMGHRTEARMGHEAQATAFWQCRYYDRNVRDNNEFIAALKYIHRNPVKRGLVEKPEDWPWSSYRHCALDEQGIVAVESPWAAYKRNHPSADRNQLSRIFAKMNDAILIRTGPAIAKIRQL